MKKEYNREDMKKVAIEQCPYTSGCNKCRFESDKVGMNCWDFAKKWLKDNPLKAIKCPCGCLHNGETCIMCGLNIDGWYYPTKDNLCVTDILTRGYEWELYYEKLDKWESIGAFEYADVFGDLLNDFEFRFKLPKTKEQIQDELIEEIIESHDYSKEDDYICRYNVIEMMKICLNKGVSHE